MAANDTSANNLPHINLATTDQAMGWLRDGWELFKRAPGIWIGIVVIYIVISLAANLIPIIGSLALALFGIVFTFGMFCGARDLEAGNPLTIGHLFAGFSSPRMGSLVLLGLLTLIGSLCVGIPAGLVAVILVAGGNGGLGLATGLLLAVLAIVLVAVLSAALLFATPLVGFNGLSPIEAVKLSFAATLKNWLPLLVWGVLAILLVLAGAIPLGLGLLVVMPMLCASYWLMYRTIFGDAPPPIANAGV